MSLSETFIETIDYFVDQADLPTGVDALIYALERAENEWDTDFLTKPRRFADLRDCSSRMRLMLPASLLLKTEPLTRLGLKTELVLASGTRFGHATQFRSLWSLMVNILEVLKSYRRYRNENLRPKFKEGPLRDKILARRRKNV